ncbi:MAG: T9SS type A sorting domain-containing protein [Bacteroidota bacterium]
MKSLLIAIFVPTMIMHAQWIKLDGPPVWETPHLAAIPQTNGSILFAGAYVSKDFGVTWQLNDKYPVTASSRLSVDTTGRVVSDTNHALFLSTNFGNDWTRIDSGLGDLVLSSVALGDKNDVWVSSEKSLYKSSDNGKSWKGVLHSEWWSITSLAYRDSRICIGTDYCPLLTCLPPGEPSFYSGVYLSMDNGDSFQYVGYQGVSVSSIILFDNFVFVSGTSFEYCSLDTYCPFPLFNGFNLADSTWSISSIGNDSTPMVFSYRNTLLAVVDSGLYAWQNNKWVHDISSPESIVAITADDHFVYVGNPAGLWRRSISDLMSADDLNTENSIVNFFLSQNYPNPFNPSTVISYQLPVTSNVTLKIFDMLGREVATLVNEGKSAGSYDVTFDAKNLSSGIYFFQMRAGEFAQTKKLIFQK